MTPFINFNHPLSIELDCDNFLLWQSQVLLILRGHDFQGYINGTLPCRPPGDDPNAIGFNFLTYDFQDYLKGTLPCPPSGDDPSAIGF